MVDEGGPAKKYIQKSEIETHKLPTEKLLLPIQKQLDILQTNYNISPEDILALRRQLCSLFTAQDRIQKKQTNFISTLENRITNLLHERGQMELDHAQKIQKIYELAASIFEQTDLSSDRAQELIHQFQDGHLETWESLFHECTRVIEDYKSLNQNNADLKSHIAQLEEQNAILQRNNWGSVRHEDSLSHEEIELKRADLEAHEKKLQNKSETLEITSQKHGRILETLKKTARIIQAKKEELDSREQTLAQLEKVLQEQAIKITAFISKAINEIVEGNDTKMYFDILSSLIPKFQNIIDYIVQEFSIQPLQLQIPTKKRNLKDFFLLLNSK